MPTKLRTLGVQGENLPTKKARTVSASDFLIGGLIAQLERKYLQSFLVHNMNEFVEIFGYNIVSSWYGWDTINLFFQNIVGTDAKLYVKAHVGNTGSAIDAVQALANIADQDVSPETTLKIKAAYRNIDEYGDHGNRVGYKITNGARFTSAADGVGTKDDLYAICDSVAGVKVGDIMKFVATAGGGATVYKKITAVDESLRKVSFSGAFHASANLADGDVVSVLGFRIQTYEKSINGIVKEVDSDIGKIYCTMAPEVSDYYVDNVFKDNRYVKAESQTHTHTLNTMFPADVSTITYLASGANGTSPTTNTHWLYGNYSAFNSDPIRFLTNPETTITSVNQYGENYCKSRWDNPKWIYNIPSNQSKSQLQVIGSSYQRSDDVLGVINGTWLKIADPFSNSVLAQPREIPNVGATMGAWIRTIGLFGIHYIPAIKQIPLYGVIGVVDTAFPNPNDTDRTEVAEYGVNITTYISGYGFVIRNFFTPSMTEEYWFANGILMRDFFKVSGTDSLQASENMPNSFSRIQEDKMAMYTFMRRMWDVGSTGSVPTGETFGISQDAEGNPTTFDDHVEVIADIINNPLTKVNAGERNIDTYFTYPSPAGSIRIRVGLMLRS
jgi:hypothetical protein